ncbi:TfoX/Sxy family protein [Calditrichota bacterium]
MPYDMNLESKISIILKNINPPKLESKKMFGGVGFMVQGNMACGVHKDSFIVRVGPHVYETALAKPSARQFDITGKPMKGWIKVEPGGFESDQALRKWVELGVSFALTLPPK